MPEKINRAVADLLSCGAPRAPAHEEASPEFGFEFDGIRAIEPPGFLESLKPAKGLALTGSGAGPGGMHFGSSGVTLREITERPEIRWKWGRTPSQACGRGAFWPGQKDADSRERVDEFARR
jgi:hypothetical protein